MNVREKMADTRLEPAVYTPPSWSQAGVAVGNSVPPKRTHAGSMVAGGYSGVASQDSAVYEELARRQSSDIRRNTLLPCYAKLTSVHRCW